MGIGALAGGSGVAAGWRRLGLFWLTILLALGLGAGTLQWLGPLPPPRRAPRAAASAPRPAEPVATPIAATRADTPAGPLVSVERTPSPARRPPARQPPAQQPGRGTPGPVHDPDPALLARGPDGGLPRIAEDGRMPMQVYAAGFDRSTRRPRIGLVVAGIGMNTTDSMAAISNLPSGVTLAFSPYAVKPQKLLDAARLSEHEYLLSLPMEPHAFPLNDPGPKALMTSLSRRQNEQRLEWLLSRIAGYVGVTGALGPLHGERFAASKARMTPVLAELADRGLLYVDPRPDKPPLPDVWSRDVDVVVDDPVTAIDGKLADLERIARTRGSALGLVGEPRPVSVQRIAAWANGLSTRGFALAPVSALVQPPPAPKTTTTADQQKP